jgi:hypothetical protein
MGIPTYGRSVLSPFVLSFPMPHSEAARVRNAPDNRHACHAAALALHHPPSLCTKCADANEAFVLEITQLLSLVVEHVGQTR